MANDERLSVNKADDRLTGKRTGKWQCKATLWTGSGGSWCCTRPKDHVQQHYNEIMGYRWKGPNNSTRVRRS